MDKHFILRELRKNAKETNLLKRRFQNNGAFVIRSLFYALSSGVCDTY